jgi:glutamyl-tRNA synthetase
VPPSRVVAPLRRQLEQEGVMAADDGQLESIVAVQRERAKTVKEMALNSLFFFRAPGAYDQKAVTKHVTGDILPVLHQVVARLRGMTEWTAPAIHGVISECAAAGGLSLGKLAQPIRIAVCGGTVSPPIDATLEILGREESLARMDQACAAWSR